MQGTLRKTLVIALVLASLFSAAQFWESTRHLEAGRAALDAWDARLSRAKEALPVKRGVIGYVGEWDVPGFPYAYWDQESEFLLSQYALAPLILKKGAAAEWNVAVLDAKAFAAWKRLNQANFQVTDVGHGVYVLHRLEAP